MFNRKKYLKKIFNYNKFHVNFLSFNVLFTKIHNDNKKIHVEKNILKDKNDVNQTEKLASVVDHVNPINYLLTHPFGKIALSHSGEIEQSPTYLGKRVFSARDIIKIMSECKKGGGLLYRGQHSVERKNGQVPSRKNFNESCHVGGDVQGVSTSSDSTVARMFAFGATFTSVLHVLFKAELSTAEVIVLDSVLLPGGCHIVESNEHNEVETTVTMPIPDFAVLGTRKAVGPLTYGRFKFNELHIDAVNVDADFVAKYELFVDAYKQFMFNHYNKHSRRVEIPKIHVNNLVSLMVGIYQEYLKYSVPEEKSVAVSNVAKVMGMEEKIDKVAAHFRTRFHLKDEVHIEDVSVVSRDDKKKRR